MEKAKKRYWEKHARCCSDRKNDRVNKFRISVKK